MSQISAIDSYYAWISQQLQALGAKVMINGHLINQPLGGLINDRDWPLTSIKEGALYLLVMDRVPKGGTRSQLGYEYRLKWTWLLIGQDIQRNQQAENRGDRYRSNMQVEENLRQANYPGFCRKIDIACDSQGNLSSTASASVIPENPYEPVYWGELQFQPKPDNDKSGVLYGAATVEVFAYTDVDPLVA